MNLNRNQIISIAVLILGVMGTSTAQLTDLFGAAITKDIVSLSSLLTAILGGINSIIGGQASQIAAVQAMPGVDKIVVNQNANSTLATLAVSQDNNKVEITPGSENAVKATAAAAQ